MIKKNMNLIKSTFKFLRYFLMLWTFLASLTSCVPGAQGLSKGRPDSITQGTTDDIQEETKICEGVKVFDAFIDLQCVDSCPATTTQVDRVIPANDYEQERIQEYLSIDLPALNLPIEENTRVLETFEANREICLPVKRPNNKITIDKGFCACRNGVPDILSDCTTFCNAKPNNGDATLYGEGIVDPLILNNFPTIHDWCTKTIDDGRTAPSCSLRVIGPNTQTDLTVTTSAGSNNFTVNIGALPFDETFIFRLVEAGSGSNVLSSAKQFMRFLPDDDTTNFIGTPLKIQSVNQYDCFGIQPKVDDSQPDIVFSEAILEQHYYFPANESPPPLAPETDFIFCHDIQSLPKNDSAIYPRLNLISGHFAVWDKTDLRFFDTDSNGKRDINDILEQKIKDEHDIDFDFDIFFNLPLPLAPDVQDGSGSAEPFQSNTGFYMRPFTNFTTGQTFCPTRDHYNSNDPVFKVMKEIIGVDTEAIYLALREPEVLQNSDGSVQTVTAFIALRESQLRKIWFYFENGQHLEHNDVTATRKPIRFYWPPNPSAPFQKNADQKLYTIGTSAEVQSGGTVFDDGGTISSQIPAPDKRFGCIPVIDSN